jgi:hypothetical protein
MIKAEKALKERQSRFVRGLEKLKAKIMKIAELIKTSDHNPYAGASSIWSPHEITGLAMMVAIAMTSMATVKKMHKRTEQK